MLMTESMLRSIISRTILIETVNSQMDQLETELESIDVQVEKVFAQMMPKLDKAVAKDKQEGVLDDQKVGDEALGVTGAIGLGLAIPMFLKIAGYAAKAFGNSLAKMESFMGGDNLEGLGDEWAEWWFDWAAAAKKKKKALMKTIATKLLSIKYDNPTPEQVTFLANTLWAILYAYLGIEAGIHAWHAFHQPDFVSKVYGGWESLMAAVKEGNAVAFLSDAISAAAEGGMITADTAGAISAVID